MRVIVDEGLSPTSPLWRQFQDWLGTRSAEVVFIVDAYPGMPDVEILDKLLSQDTVLLTHDRVLHNRALNGGIRSFTRNAQGQLTRKKLPLTKETKQPQAPSVLKNLKPHYQHALHPLTLKLSADLSPKALKAHRTRRRRIRSYFGSADNIAKVALTLGTRVHHNRLLCGYAMHIQGYQGVRGLRASESYCLDPVLPPDPGLCLLHAACALFHLHLEQVKQDFFIIPPDALEIAQQVVAQGLPEPASGLHRSVRLLISALPGAAVYPCVKGRFYTQMEQKLNQLTTFKSNEIVPADFTDIIMRLGS